MLATGKIGVCYWTLIVGTSDDVEFFRYLDFIRNVLGQSMDPNDVVLTMMFDMPLPNAVKRRALASAIEDGKKTGQPLPHAVVTNSKIGRGIMSAINWMQKPVAPEGFFAAPEPAFTWLRGYNPQVSAEQIAQEIEAKAPGFQALRWQTKVGRQ